MWFLSVMWCTLTTLISAEIGQPWAKAQSFQFKQSGFYQHHFFLMLHSPSDQSSVPFSTLRAHIYKDIFVRCETSLERAWSILLDFKSQLWRLPLSSTSTTDYLFPHVQEYKLKNNCRGPFLRPSLPTDRKLQQQNHLAIIKWVKRLVGLLVLFSLSSY